jgi:hypothetical protein
MDTLHFVKHIRYQLASAIMLSTIILSCNQSGSKSKQNTSNVSLATDSVISSQKFPFEKIEYASFDINSFRTKLKNHVYIGLYSIIDKDGLVTVRNDDTYHDTLKFYTYQLSPEQLDKLNLVFSQKEHVKDNMVTVKDDSGFYGGYYHFVLVTRKNSDKDSLSFVISLMSNEFTEAYDMLDSVYYILPDAKPTKRFAIPQYFNKAVYASYKKSPYLPKVETIPSFRLEDQ